MFAAMAAMLVVGLAVPEAFDSNAALFGIAYMAVRLLQLALYAIAGKRDPDLLGAVLGKVPPAALAPAILITAAFFDGPPQATLWVVVLVVDYLGVLVGRSQGWRVSPAHFAERHGLIVIIALGESVVSIGIAAAGAPLTRGIVVAAVLGIVVVSALSWAYFDVYAVMAERRLSELHGAVRTRLARDYFSYLHLPMIAGIVLFALGLKKTIEHVGDPLATVPALALCGGLSLYYLSHVVLRIRVVQSLRRTGAEHPGWIGPGRLLTGLAMLALVPIALEAPALAALALVTAASLTLVAWDVVHYREERREVRLARR